MALLLPETVTVTSHFTFIYSAVCSLLYIHEFVPTMEALIEEVKSHPCLWLTTNPDYKNINMKTTSWEVIANNLNRTGKFIILFIYSIGKLLCFWIEDLVGHFYHIMVFLKYAYISFLESPILC